MALLCAVLVLLALLQQRLLPHAHSSVVIVHSRSTSPAAAAIQSSFSEFLKGPLRLNLAYRLQQLKNQQHHIQQPQPFPAYVRLRCAGAGTQPRAITASYPSATAALNATATKVAAPQSDLEHSASTTATLGTKATAAAAPDLPFRIGHGYDMHRLSTNPQTVTGPLVLSGVSFASEATEAAAEATTADGEQPQAILGAAAAVSAALRGGHQLLSAASLGIRRLFRRAIHRTSTSSNDNGGGGGCSNVRLGVIAHSDGDVVLHAAADAIFAASGAADIGQHFPDTAAENKGRDSRDFVSAAAAAAAAAGYTVAQLDVTLLLQRPRIGCKKHQMVENLAAALGIHSSQVSIKAKTGEGIGPVGRSEAVECHAVVLLQRMGLRTPQ